MTLPAFSQSEITRYCKSSILPVCHLTNDRKSSAVLCRLKQQAGRKGEVKWKHKRAGITRQKCMGWREGGSHWPSQREGTHSETQHHLHLGSSGMVPEHYLHWLVVFPQESTGKPENKPPSFSTSLSLYHSLCFLAPSVVTGTEVSPDKPGPSICI